MLCVRFGYTPSELYTQLREYTDEERRLYLGHLRVDRVFIFFYGIPLIIFVLFAGERVAVLMPVHPWLALLPVAAGIADWIEDARLTSIAIRLFAKDTGELIEPAPQLDDRVRTASNTTRAKWFLVALSGTVGIGGVLLAAIGGLATAK